MRIIFIIFIVLLSNLFAVYDATVNASTLNMYYQDYNFLMGLTGLFMGITFTYTILFMITKFGGR